MRLLLLLVLALCVLTVLSKPSKDTKDSGSKDKSSKGSKDSSGKKSKDSGSKDKSSKDSNSKDSSSKGSKDSSDSSDSSEEALTCYWCTGTPEECAASTLDLQCFGDGEYSCYTKYSQDGQRVQTGCISSETCANQQAQNGAACDKGNYYSSTCTVCCDTYLCNNVTVPDPCASNPCNNGGTCKSDGSSYTCRCPSGWTGPTCSEEPNPCDSNPCENGGTCEANGSTFRCKCRPEWSGRICTEEPRPCEINQCENGGTCISDGSTFTCQCQTGWTGPLCTDAQSGYTCAADNNPCTPENIAAGLFYWPSVDPAKFVQCDEFGQCFVMPCAPGTVWDQGSYTCVRE